MSSTVLASLLLGFAAADPVQLLVDHEGPGRAQLIAELEYEGFAAHPKHCTSAELSALRECGAAESVVAVVRVDLSTRPNRIQIYVPGTEHLTVTDMRSAGPRGEALAAVELLRAALLPMAEKPGATPPPVRRLLRPKHPRWELSVGAQTLWSPGGVPVSVAPVLDLRWFPHAQLGVELRGTSPVHSRSLREGPNRADVTVGRALAGFVVRWLPRRRVDLDSALGLGASFLRMVGRASPNLTLERDTIAATTAYARLGFGLPLGQRLRWRIHGGAASTFPTLGVRFGDARVATWGRLVLSGSTSLGVVW